MRGVTVINSELWQIKIYDVIKAENEISVSSLAERFNVSPMTIRRILSQLESSQLIERSYGKARIIDNSKSTLSFDVRQTINLPEKEKIAEIAIQLLRKNNIKSIYLDGSSTAVCLAKAIPKSLSLVIFTNSVAVLNVLLQKPWLKTYVIGGFLDHETNALNDVLIEDLCKQIYVDASFTSCGGFSTKGTFNNDFPGTPIRRIMMKNSAVNYLLADHTKFDLHGIFLLTTWDMINALITDRKPQDTLFKSLRDNNVKIHFPDES